MTRLIAPCIGAALLFMPFGASAQSLNPDVPDFRSEMLTECFDGLNLGQILNLSNPLSLIGSVMYTETTDNDARLMRQPMNLASVVTEATAPDQPVCSFAVEISAAGQVSILGLTAQAQRGDVFKIESRLIARQTLAPVVQDGQSLPPWEARVNFDRFRSILAPPERSNAYLIDGMSIYLITVERYRTQGWGGQGIFGVFGGNVSYKKDETFRGSKILVTGDRVRLASTMFPTVPGVVPGQQPAAIGSPTPLTARMSVLQIRSTEQALEIAQ